MNVSYAVVIKMRKCVQRIVDRKYLSAAHWSYTREKIQCVKYDMIQTILYKVLSIQSQYIMGCSTKIIYITAVLLVYSQFCIGYGIVGIYSLTLYDATDKQTIFQNKEISLLMKYVPFVVIYISYHSIKYQCNIRFLNSNSHLRR